MTASPNIANSQQSGEPLRKDRKIDTVGSTYCTYCAAAGVLDKIIIKRAFSLVQRAFVVGPGRLRQNP